MPASLRIPAGLFLLLMLYSFLGWCGEMLYCSIGQGRLCEKRGFLTGPLCPIYGHGALLVLWALDGGRDSLALTFLGGMALTTAVEYVTSFLMERLFHMRWWDYSRRRFQLNGRVCLLNSLLFGLACVALCHVVHPRVMGALDVLFARGAAIPLALVLCGVYAADIAVSVRSALRMGSRLSRLHALQEELQRKLEALRQEQSQLLEERRLRLRQGLEALEDLGGEHAQRLARLKAEAQQRMRQLLDGQDFFERRLLLSHPTLRSDRYGEALEKLREHLDKRKRR